LVVEDDPAIRELLRGLLERQGFSVVAVEHGEAALRHIAAHPPDLVLTDVHMPHMDGLTLLGHLRAREETRHLPLILVSGSSSADERVAGLLGGANDCVVKPFAPEELIARVINHLRIARTAGQWRAASLIDALTQLWNRRGLELQLLRETARAVRETMPLAILFIDVDRFKAINDQCGHATGDRVLLDVAGALARTVRTYDVVARYGGDEFVVVLLSAGRPVALQVADRIRGAVAQIDHQALPFAVQISIGCATVADGYPSGVNLVHELIAAADRAMYADKRARASSLLRGVRDGGSRGAGSSR
jgi:diguanylate cyclase (GGDEF)-like protein